MVDVPSSVLVVGAGVSGWRVCRELRKLGFDGPLTLIGAERHLPYDRPPLSKKFLEGTVPDERILLTRDEEVSTLGVDHRPGSVASTVEPGRVSLESGETISADAIVLATGAHAARPALLDGHPEVFTLRTMDDALALRSALESAESLLVLGGGFIGAEVATTARSRGVDVTLVELQTELFASTLGTEPGRRLRELHEANGVRVLLGSAVESIESADGACTVALADGTRLTADVVVAGFGARLNAEPLATSGLDLTSGVPCDADGRVHGLPGVYAVGDVARWHDPRLGGPQRREHWSSAGDQGAVVAHTILGHDVPGYLRNPPYFWSDQVGIKVQLVGWPEAADGGDWIDVEDTPPQTVFGYRRGDDLVAAVIFGKPRLLGRFRTELAEAQWVVGG